MHTRPLDPPTRLSSVIREGFPWFFLILHSECGQSILQELVWLSGSGPCPGEKGTLLDKGLLLLFLIKAKDPLARSECGCERHTSACLGTSTCVCMPGSVCVFQQLCTHLLPVPVPVCVCTMGVHVCLYTCRHVCKHVPCVGVSMHGEGAGPGVPCMCECTWPCP